MSRSLTMLIISCSVLVTGVGAKQEVGPTKPIAAVIGDFGLIAVTPWDVGVATLMCVVTRETGKAGDDIPYRRLTIYREKDSKLTPLFVFEDLDILLSMYPLGESRAPLLTTWAGGSAYHIRGFAYVDGKVQQVLDTGSRAMPEVITDQGGGWSILVTQMQMTPTGWHITPKSPTEIYKWNGKSYDKRGPVPWPRRFE